MGALALGFAHARPSAQAPINTVGNLSAQVSVWGGVAGGPHILF
jgi:hypothetical protein